MRDRQRFGLHAKNARAEELLVNNGMQQNAETASWVLFRPTFRVKS